MAYLILVIGLILIYIGLKKDTQVNNSSILNKTVEIKQSDKELENLREELNYLIVRVEDIENSLLLINENSNAYRQLEFASSDNDDGNIKITEFDEVLQDAMQANKVIDTVAPQNTDNNDIKHKIFELFDKGKTVDEISSILRVGKGEVSLRLGLRKLNK